MNVALTCENPKLQNISILSSCLLGLVVGWGGVGSNQGAWAASERELLLLGVFINSREVGTLDVFQENEVLLIPLKDLAQLAEFTLTFDNPDAPTTITIATPIGETTLAASELIQIDNILHITGTLLKEKTGIDATFRQALFALDVRLPWDVNQTTGAAALLTPEVRPPAHGLIGMRIISTYSSQAESSNLFTTTFTRGRLAGGRWQINILNSAGLNSEGNLIQPQLENYAYTNNIGPVQYLIGRQQPQLSPLLNSLDMTGVQVAYTNYPSLFKEESLSQGQLISRESNLGETLRGSAPPASIAALVVNRALISQQQVGLDGQYEFTNVALPSGSATEVAIYIFDRNNLQTPIAVRQLNLSSSNLLLPSGAHTHLAGLGVGENILQNWVSSESSTTSGSGSLGFYQYRHGINSNFTTEFTVQQAPQNLQAQIGGIWRFQSNWIAAAGAGVGDVSNWQPGIPWENVSYGLDISGNYPNLQINLNSFFVPADFITNNQPNSGLVDRYNHSATIAYQFAPNFNLGLIARQQDDGVNASQYVLPTVNWQPFSGASVSARPDILGNYQLNAFYRPTSALQFTAFSYNQTATITGNYKISREFSLNGGTNLQAETPSRYFLVLQRNAPSLNDLSFNIGLSLEQQQPGFIIGASREVFSGVLLRAEYQSQPPFQNTVGVGNNQLFLLSLSTDLNFAGGVRAGRSGGVSNSRGAIGGRIRTLAGQPLSPEDLEGSQVRVGNRGSATMDGRGNFFVGNLAPGVYPVDFIPGNLPVEYSVVKSRIIAEVAGGAVTSVVFEIQAEYGVAGRIRDALGQGVAGVTVEAVNAEGNVSSRGRSDQFGLYRIDGLVPGSYTLRIAQPPTGTTAPPRSVTLTDDFLFEQDFQLQ